MRYALARFTNVFFHRNSNSTEISFHSRLDSNTVITTKFCTWHDSYAVVTCAKMCCDLMARNGVMARRNFHRIWIADPASGSENPKSKAPHSMENNRNHQQYSLYLVFKSCRNHQFTAIPLCEPQAIPSGIAPQSWSRCHSVVAQLAAGRLILF